MALKSTKTISSGLLKIILPNFYRKSTRETWSLHIVYCLRKCLNNHAAVSGKGNMLKKRRRQKFKDLRCPKQCPTFSTFWTHIICRCALPLTYSYRLQIRRQYFPWTYCCTASTVYWLLENKLVWKSPNLSTKYWEGPSKDEKRLCSTGTNMRHMCICCQTHSKPFLK